MVKCAAHVVKCACSAVPVTITEYTFLVLKGSVSRYFGPPKSSIFCPLKSAIDPTHENLWHPTLLCWHLSLLTNCHLSFRWHVMLASVNFDNLPSALLTTCYILASVTLDNHICIFKECQATVASVTIVTIAYIVLYTVQYITFVGMSCWILSHLSI